MVVPSTEIACCAFSACIKPTRGQTRSKGEVNDMLITPRSVTCTYLTAHAIHLNNVRDPHCWFLFCLLAGLFHLSLSLSLSYTHTHTHKHARAQSHMRARTHARTQTYSRAEKNLTGRQAIILWRILNTELIEKKHASSSKTNQHTGAYMHQRRDCFVSAI